MTTKRRSTATHRFVLLGYIALTLACLIPAAESSADTAGATVAGTATPAWRRLVDHSELSYYLKLNGPNVSGPLKQSYNPFIRARWPLQFYHDVTYEYHFDWKYSAGFELSAVQNVTHGVKNNWGTPINTGWSFFHPLAFFEVNSLLNTSWMWMNGEVSVFFPTSDLASKQTMLFSVAFDETWNLRLPWPKWSFYLTTRVKPTVYQNSVPNGPFDVQRETLFLSAEHFLGYRFDPHWEVTHSSHFDWDHYTLQKPWLKKATDDRMQFQVNYYTAGDRMNFGVYLLTPFSPRWATTTFGFDFKIYLVPLRM